MTRAAPALLHLPRALALGRAAMGPGFAALAATSVPGGWLVACLVVVGLSDLFDGVLARRWGVATARLRLLDSTADIVFYLGVLGAVALRHPSVGPKHAVGLALLLGLVAARLLVERAKYGRIASYHMRSARAWGVSLVVGLAALFGWGATGWPVGVAIWLGVVANVEAFAATLLLARWHHDVPSVMHALRLRRADRAAAAGP